MAPWNPNGAWRPQWGLGPQWGNTTTRGPGDHKGARGPQLGPYTRDPNWIWGHNGARGLPWILGATRGLGNHNETAMGSRNTREPAANKGAQDHKGTWGHNEDYVPGTLVE